MRLPPDLSRRFAVIGLTLALAACGRGGSDLAGLDLTAPVGAGAANDPASDYPVVLGEPFTVDGMEFTPFDTMNYDEVGYATLDQAAGAGVTAAHKTLPLPSYVEVTALDSGKTTLVRVERRGPMTGSRLLALSAEANAQLGINEGAAIRVRRVNPPEAERAMLRAGASAPERIETPPSLLTVLRRKLPATGSANLATVAAGPDARPQMPVSAPAPQAVAVPASTTGAFQQAFSEDRRVVTAYPLAPLGGAAVRVTPVARATAPVPAPVARPAPATAQQAQADGAFVVQAAAFANRENASKAASSVGGFVEQSGKYFRVRIGPFANRGQAEAALAKARAAGYSDARVFTTG